MRIPYALAVHGADERRAVVAVLRRHRTIMGPETRRFESKVAALLAKQHGVMVNSGSSANLLALEVLDLPEKSEVITPILTFSTTVAPIIQQRLVPAFADVELGSYQVNIDHVEALVGPKTRALLIPSLLGNLPDLAALRDLARRRGLWFIEDSCDTLGATYRGRPTGAYSDISTTSFYGSHVITAAGGGGMVCVNDEATADRLRMLRGWGRGSAITESEDVAERFAGRLVGVPYDSKFVFQELGYNMLPLELSAAFGLAQLKRLREFARIRRRNFAALVAFFRDYEEFFVLPRELPGARTNWLAFPLTLRPGAPFTRLALVRHLEGRNVQTRPLFSGNILRHPGFRRVPSRTRRGGYPVADHVMKHSLLVGCHHGLRAAHIGYLMQTFADFLKQH